MMEPSKIRQYRIEYCDIETDEHRETIAYAVSRVAAREQFFAGDPGLKRRYLWCSEIE